MYYCGRYQTGRFGARLQRKQTFVVDSLDVIPDSRSVVSWRSCRAPLRRTERTSTGAFAVSDVIDLQAAGAPKLNPEYSRPCRAIAPISNDDPLFHAAYVHSSGFGDACPTGPADAGD